MNSKIIAVYRLKNEARWIKKSLESIMDICSEVIILDNGSTDDTQKICKSFSKVVDVIEQPNLHFDEARDRNTLLQAALRRKPDYILNLDGDEILMPNSKEILEEELEVLYPNEHVFSFQFLTIWDRTDQIRCDGIKAIKWHSRLLKLMDQPSDLIIAETHYPGNAHASGIPSNAIGYDSPVRSNVKILHYGYFDENLRQSKFYFYNELTPDNKEQDNYKHLISGNGIFSGPRGIEIKKLPAGLYYENL